MSNNVPATTFGQEVRRRREGDELTLDALAERTGLTPNYIGSIELGKRDPSLSTVLALAKGLGIRPGELFGTIDELNPSAEEVAQLFDQMNPEGQKAVLALLNALSKKKVVAK